MRAYVLPTLAAVAAVRAVQLEDYVPECAPACIYEAVDTHSTCEPDDSACLCRDIYSLKRHSERCLESSCSDAEYGESMLGYDNFCDAVENNPEPTVTTSTTATVPDTPTTTSAPPPETTVEPPPETTTQPPPETTVEPPPETESFTEEPTEQPTEEPTEEPSEEPTGAPTDNPEWPPTNTVPDVPTSLSIPTTEELPTITTSITTGNDTIPVPTETTPTTTGDGGGGGDETTTTEGGPSPTGAAGHLNSNFGALAGGLLIAALFRV